MTDPLVSLVLLGIGYTLFATVIWPCIPIVVNKLYVSLAFGVTSSVVNLVLVIFPMIVAKIHERTHMYYMVKIS